MHRNIWKWMALVAMVSVAVMGMGGCSQSSAECKVTYDANKDSFEIVVQPPGESGEFSMDGTMKKSTNISREAGKDMVKITQYDLDLERTFKESGSVYRITGFIKFDDSGKKSKLVDYALEVTGGVYGETPHTCSK
jgi:hypothetical protein